MWKLLFTFVFLVIATPSKAAEPTWEEIKKLEEKGFTRKQLYTSFTTYPK